MTPDGTELAVDLARPQGTVAVSGLFPDGVSLGVMRALTREVWMTFPACYGVIDGRHDYEVAIELIASGRAPVDRLVTSRWLVTSRFALEERRKCSGRPPTSRRAR